MPFLPLDAAKAGIRRAKRFLDLTGTPLPDLKIRNDLLRMAVVVSVAAVDSYMHWLVYRQLSEVRRQGDLPASLAKLEIPFKELASMAEAALDARREDRESRPWVQVKNATQRRLLRETFQSYDQVALALSLAGIQKGWARTADELQTTPDQIKTRLNNLVHRRNQIVHEGDIRRASRPQRLQYNSLTLAAVRDDVSWVEKLLAAVDKVVVAGNPT